MKLVLFDIDGTLITHRGAGRRAMRTAFEHVFGTAGGIDHYDLSGRNDTRIVHDVMAAEGWDATRVRERLDDFFEAYVGGLTAEIGDGRHVVILPGVAAMVERPDRAGGVALGLVPGNIEEGARIKLLPTGLWPRFQVGAYGSDHMDRRRLPSLAARRAHARPRGALPPRGVDRDRRHPARRGLRARLRRGRGRGGHRPVPARAAAGRAPGSLLRGPWRPRARDRRAQARGVIMVVR